MNCNPLISDCQASNYISKKREKWIPIFHWQAGKHSQPIVTEIIIIFVLKKLFIFTKMPSNFSSMINRCPSVILALFLSETRGHRLQQPSHFEQLALFINYTVMFIPLPITAV